MMDKNFDSPEGQTMSVYTLIDRLEERVLKAELKIKALCAITNTDIDFHDPKGRFKKEQK